MNTEVKLVGFHDGKQGDLNDNVGFCRAFAHPLFTEE